MTIMGNIKKMKNTTHISIEKLFEIYFIRKFFLFQKGKNRKKKVRYKAFKRKKFLDEGGFLSVYLSKKRKLYFYWFWTVPKWRK